MKNAALFYAVIAVGIIALAVGVYYLTGGQHPARAYTGLGLGVVLLIAGVAGMFMTRSKAIAK